MNPLVSIIIPVYNVAPYIENSLRSAFSQTYSNIEYIIVDDCGNDNSMDIVAKLKDEYPERIIYVMRHSKNRGQSAARNTGIKASSGDYLFFMDSDDMITCDCIETHVKIMGKSDADFTHGGFEVIGGLNHSKNNNQVCITKEGLFQSFFKGVIMPSPCNKLIRASLFKKDDIEFTEGIIYEDVEWVFKLVNISTKAICFSNKTYKYIIRPNSTTTINFNKKNIESAIYISNILLNYIDKLDSSDIQDLLRRYVSYWRFRISCRLVIAESITKSKKKDYYYALNNEFFKRLGSGLYSKLLKLPFFIFYNLFSFPRKLYSIIVYSKFGKLFN